MDSGIPQSLLTSMGEIIFNDLTGDATAATLADVGGTIWPGPGVVPAAINADWHTNGLPPGNGYLMQFTGGMHGAPVRNPVDNRPHKHGGIIHRFYAGPKHFTLDGLIVGDTPEIRQVLYDYLVGWFFSAMQEDARYFYDPPGYDVRFITCRNYDQSEIVGPSGSPGSSPSGIAGPKQYIGQFVAVNPFAYTYTEDDTTISGGSSAFVPNDGNAETWPVIEVYGYPGDPLRSFTVDNGTFEVEWSGNIDSPDHLEINMFNETMYVNGNSTNKLSGLNDQSDFWSIPPGGCTVSVTPGAHHVVIKSNDAWV